MVLTSIPLIVGITTAVPMGLAIFRRRTSGDRELALLKLARRVHPISALSATTSFAFLPGRLAASLIVPWLLFGGLLGVTAISRLANGGWRFPSSVCYTA